MIEILEIPLLGSLPEDERVLISWCEAFLRKKEVGAYVPGSIRICNENSN